MPLQLGISGKAKTFFNNFSGYLHFDALILGLC